jgi:membrane protein YqaA with SNARE-associated domain
LDREKNHGDREVIAISARTKYILTSTAFIILTILSIYLVIRYWHIVLEMQRYGYLGIFVIGFVAGSSLPVPISYLLMVFTLGGILNPALVGVAGGLGAGIGGTLVYLLGRGSRRFFPNIKAYSVDQEASNKLAAKFVNWAQRRGSIVVFVMSAMLNPVFGPMAIAMGALRFRLFKFFLMCTAGNMLKAMIVSYAGYLGLGSLLRWIGGAP